MCSNVPFLTHLGVPKYILFDIIINKIDNKNQVLFT